MVDNFLNSTGLAYFYNRLKTVFAAQGDLDALETRVDGIVSQGGEPNVIDTVKVNGTALAVTNKAVDVIVPTATSDLTNDSGFQTAQDVEDAIGDALDGVTGISYEVVQALPATGEAGVIYLLSNSGSTGNIYDEYIWAGSAFEKIGTTDVDLSGYWQTSDLVAITTAEIDTLFT